MAATLRIAHIGDIHLGSHQYGYKVRKASLRETLIKLADQLMAYDIVLLAGDLCDHPYPEADDLYALQSFCKLLRDAGVKVYACVGNHDKQDESEVQICDIISASGPSDRVHNSVAGIKIGVYNHRWSKKLPELIDSIPDDLDIIMMHQSAGGFLPSIMAPELNEELFRQVCAKCKYLALGDLHIHKQMKVGDCIAAYPGVIDFLKTSYAYKDFKFWDIAYNPDQKKVIECRSVGIEVASKTLVCSTEEGNWGRQINAFVKEEIGEHPFLIVKRPLEKAEEVESWLEDLKKVYPKLTTHTLTLKPTEEDGTPTQELRLEDDGENDFIAIVHTDKTIEEHEVDIVGEIWRNASSTKIAAILQKDLEEEVKDDN